MNSSGSHTIDNFEDFGNIVGQASSYDSDNGYDYNYKQEAQLITDEANAEAEKAGTQGRVIATFVVEKDGSITNAKVVKAIDPLLDAEALRIIHEMPKWNPGRINGQPVRVKYELPVIFK